MSPRPLAPPGNAPAHDLIATPPALARAIVDAYAPTGRLLDPARGGGAFYCALRQHSNDVGWCEIDQGRDFFDWRTPVDWIITNPPWSRLRPFLLHGFAVAREVVYLATITHFVTRARIEDAYIHGFGLRRFMLVEQPPPPWPSSGFQLAAVWLSKGWKGPTEWTT